MRGDGDILWIPVLDIISSLVAVMLTLVEVKAAGDKDILCRKAQGMLELP